MTRPQDIDVLLGDVVGTAAAHSLEAHDAARLASEVANLRIQTGHSDAFPLVELSQRLSRISAVLEDASSMAGDALAALHTPYPNRRPQPGTTAKEQP